MKVEGIDSLRPTSIGSLPPGWSEPGPVISLVCSCAGLFSPGTH